MERERERERGRKEEREREREIYETQLELGRLASKAYSMSSAVCGVTLFRSVLIGLHH